jgi:hypothetical protein
VQDEPNAAGVQVRGELLPERLRILRRVDHGFELCLWIETIALAAALECRPHRLDWPVDDRVHGVVGHFARLPRV